jgi:hypothetical protein
MPISYTLDLSRRVAVVQRSSRRREIRRANNREWHIFLSDTNCFTLKGQLNATSAIKWESLTGWLTV